MANITWSNLHWRSDLIWTFLRKAKAIIEKFNSNHSFHHVFESEIGWIFEIYTETFSSLKIALKLEWPDSTFPVRNTFIIQKSLNRLNVLFFLVNRITDDGRKRKEGWKKKEKNRFVSVQPIFVSTKNWKDSKEKAQENLRCDHVHGGWSFESSPDHFSC